MIKKSLQRHSWMSSMKHSGLWILIAFIFLSFLRLMFWIINSNHFQTSNSELASAFSSGLRFDLIVIFYSWIPVLLFTRLLGLTKNNLANQMAILLKSLWFMGIAAFSLMDAYYFKFSKTRSGIEIWDVLHGQNTAQLFAYALDYWYVVLLLFVLFVFSYKIFRKIGNRYPVSILALVICSIFLFFPMRGSLSDRPLRSTDAGLFVSHKLVPLALNTPLVMMENWNHSEWKLDLNSTNPATKTTSSYKDSIGLNHNVVIIILESFGKEYTALNRGYTFSYTPFLDSLMNESLVCERAYANGLKSMEALPAIYSGIPNLEKRALLKGPYAHNDFESLNSILAKLNYSSSFFHGANPMSMGFQSYLISTGLSNYYSKDQYIGNAQDYDGTWGIYDEPYLLNFSNQLDSFSEPFVSGVFSLSSHHPYSIPEALENKFPKGTLDIHESIGYTDYALKKFFENAQGKAWFQNTIFIITADHSSENAMHAFRTPSGKYEIPLLFYAPGIIEPGRITKTVSQCDILPSILDLINYPYPIWTFGASIFNSTTEGLVIHNDNGSFHITEGDWNYGINEDNGLPLFLFNIAKDPNCLDNLIGTSPDQELYMHNKLIRELAFYKDLMGKNAFN
jgi:phosphoglycerol transferase MdoB-like AlkP superfamily enzyme